MGVARQHCCITMQVLSGVGGGTNAPLTAPTSLVANTSSTSVEIAFVPPTDDGGSAITNYQYSFNGSTYTALSPADAASPVSLTGLTASTSYTVYLKAVNVVGAGVASSSLTFTTQAPPAPPTLATPTFSSITSTSGGFTFTITNYDAANTYSVSTSAGSVSRTTSSVTQSGLGYSTSATVTVSVSRSGYTGASANATGTSQAQPVCTSCTYAFTTTEGGNCGTCNIFGNTHIVCYDIIHYTGSPSGCAGCAPAIGGWYECVGTCCAVCGTYC